MKYSAICTRNDGVPSLLPALARGRARVGRRNRRPVAPGSPEPEDFSLEALLDALFEAAVDVTTDRLSDGTAAVAVRGSTVAVEAETAADPDPEPAPAFSGEVAVDGCDCDCGCDCGGCDSDGSDGGSDGGAVASGASGSKGAVKTN